MIEPDARWSLANERTLLAYTRTALAFVVAGFAIAGSHTVADTPGWIAAVGLPFITVGASISVSGRRRYLEAREAIRSGQELPSPTTAMRLPWLLALLALISFAVATAQLFTS